MVVSIATEPDWYYSSSYWPGIPGHKDSLAVGLNALTLMDITKNVTYGVEIESLALEINAPASS